MAVISPIISKSTIVQCPRLAKLFTHLGKGCKGLTDACTGKQAIVEVFPQLHMLLEINAFSLFRTLIIHPELPTLHRLAVSKEG
jgi:hypothetical protein